MAGFQRQKNSVMLMELIIVILFFSIATAIALQGFVQAHQMSRQSLRMTYALNEAQNWSERISASKDPEALLVESGWQGDQGAYELVSAEDRYTLSLTLSSESTQAGVIWTGAIDAYDDALADQPKLFTLPVSRYVPDDGGVR